MSEQKLYYISHEGEQQGPWSLGEIVDKVKSNQLSLMDYLFDETAEDWILLMEHQLLAQKLKDQKPKAAPKPQQMSPQPSPQVIQESSSLKAVPEPQKEQLASEWYVLKGENKFGPFAFTDVVKMLQQQVVFEFDYAWRPGMSTWERIADLETFSAENIEKLKKTLMPDIEEVYFRRRHRRVNFNSTILIHDNKSVWKGQGVEISAGGAGVIMENTQVTSGQTIYLHFKPGDGVPPFNAVCEVVSKKHVDGVKDKNAPVVYGLKFVNVSPSTQKFITEYSKRSEAA